MTTSNCIECKRLFTPRSFEVDFGFGLKKIHYTKYCVLCENLAVEKAQKFLQNYSVIFDEREQKHKVVPKHFSFATAGGQS